ncbi:hypothetical protein GCM10011386_37650 [Parapedobacter defluvii]|uniref:Uncharacterized protein n=2 Tax=Parapedobacter defluvii TaxID=2045106 RepID=A0ABQ1MNZ7_9SPHI|nr:hypothetical protein GCM10011386_37650 [Parapedobacter defluvii]
MSISVVSHVFFVTPTHFFNIKRMGTNNTFPDFGHSAAELSAFAISLDVFIISLKNGKIVRFIPKDANQFRVWLRKSGIRDVNSNESTTQLHKEQG